MALDRNYLAMHKLDTMYSYETLIAILKLDTITDDIKGTHSLTHLLTHSLIHLLTHSLTYSSKPLQHAYSCVCMWIAILNVRLKSLC